MDRVKAFFNGRWFEPRHKTKVHTVQIFLIITAICLSGGRLATLPSNVPRSRSDVMAISMSVKSLVILLYQLLTEHVSRFKRWGSLKANAILNTLEILFWFVVVILVLQSNTRFCQGVSCGLSWMVALVAVVLMKLYFWASVVSIADFRYFKATGNPRGASLPMHRPYTTYEADSSSFSVQATTK